MYGQTLEVPKRGLQPMCMCAVLCACRSPSAIINQLQAAGKHAVAESLSQCYLIQYLIATVSLSGFTAVALHLVFGDDV
jgi:hypothetical protein